MSREIVQSILGSEMTRKIWTANYTEVLPISIQDFDLSAVLPAVFYMFRYGQRRGPGRFLATFCEKEGTTREKRRSATVDRIAGQLVEDPLVAGFEEPVGKAILGDLLLCYCLENVKRSLGRSEQVQRVAPVHYLASWVDLPETVGHLRFVPEMMVAMLADQQGQVVKQNSIEDRTRFAVGCGFERNTLLEAFSTGMTVRGELASRTSDRFEEAATVGIDQLLMIRTAQLLECAPEKLRGGEGEQISNQRPIAAMAAAHFSEDIRRFVRSYAGVIPRQSLVPILESCMAVGLTTVVRGVIDLMAVWADTGELPQRHDQTPGPLFVDASQGTVRQLRQVSEQCFDDFMRRTERFPVVLMAARLLDYGARYNRTFRAAAAEARPDATKWINLLGSILHERHEDAGKVLNRFDEDTEKLAERLDEEAPTVAAVLRGTGGTESPVWRMAEALTMLQGRRSTQSNMFDCLDSATMAGRPNGLVAKRRGAGRGAQSGARSREVRSLVLTDSVLDYLLHLHALSGGNRGGTRFLSLREFLAKIRTLYGFYVDQAPVGMSISSELLRTNRDIVERRLRDLGLLVGVNDAEEMKCLEPRFAPREESGNGGY